MTPLLSRFVPRGRKHGHRRLFVALALVLPVGLVWAGPARGSVIPPNVPIAGMSQLDHAQNWIHVMTNIPAAINPILDMTGAEAFRGQFGSVLYLAGSFGMPTDRSITIGPDTTVFFPLINSWWDNSTPFGDPPNNFTAAELLALAEIPPDRVQNLFVTLNGQPVGGNLVDFRQTSDPNNPFYNVFYTQPNLYTDLGIDPTLGTGIYPTSLLTMTDGYWMGIRLTPGLHILSFGGEFIDTDGNVLFSQNNTFRILVTPEPVSAAVWGLLVTVGAVVARGRRHRRESPATIA